MVEQLATELSLPTFVTHDEDARRVHVEQLTRERRGLRVRLAVVHVVRAYEHLRAVGQAQVLHDRFGTTDGDDGDRAQCEIGRFDIGQQFGQCVGQVAGDRAPLGVAIQAPLAQFLESW
ncbi:hypothetical protein B1218_37765 [Pseudomonas ogarae]|nr:hypothetical protein B1218_37765 [Pseudomonas ogarae]